MLRCWSFVIFILGYSLVLQCLPKVHMLMAWSPSLAHATIGRWWYPNKVGPRRRKFGQGEMCLWRWYWNPSPPSLSLCILAIKRWTGLTCHSSCHDTVPPQAQSNRVEQPWAKTPETMSQNKPALFLSRFISGTSYSNEKWTHFVNEEIWTHREQATSPSVS